MARATGHWHRPGGLALMQLPACGTPTRCMASSSASRGPCTHADLTVCTCISLNLCVVPGAMLASGTRHRHTLTDTLYLACMVLLSESRCHVSTNADCLQLHYEDLLTRMSKALSFPFLLRSVPSFLGPGPYAQTWVQNVLHPIGL